MKVLGGEHTAKNIIMTTAVLGLLIVAIIVHA